MTSVVRPTDRPTTYSLWRNVNVKDAMMQIGHTVFTVVLKNTRLQPIAHCGNITRGFCQHGYYFVGIQSIFIDLI